MEDSYPPPQILIYQKFQSIIVKGYINETERKENKSFFFFFGGYYILYKSYEKC